jgi:acetyl-CoA C-acetyltransferase
VPDDRTPILVGGGQVTQRDVEPAAAKEPLGLMVDAARLAAADAGGGASLLAAVDSVAVVNVLCWRYRNPPRLLAEQVGARPSEELYSTIGGNTPQWLVNETADRIADGRVGVALIAGAEAMRTLLRAQRTGTPLAWSGDGTGTPTLVGDTRDGTTDAENAHGMQLPTQVYPLFENALRAARGLDLAVHRARLGALCAGMSAVAATHPDAWFRTARSAADLVEVSPANRMIAFPYPKLMNAMIEVDQGAAVLMTSVGRARALGIPSDRWVYLRGCGDAQDHWFVSDRPDLARSPAIRVAGARALAAAGADIADVAHLDLYSCFPSAVQLARDALGIADDDPRPVTVTGGLPYFGGPGNDYALHAVVTMLQRLRAAPGTLGLVSALGWYVTKHSVGVYSTAPGAGPWRRETPETYQHEAEADPPPTLAHEPRGRGVVETYTVLHERDGAPMRGVIVGRLGDGRRFLANLPGDRDLLAQCERRELVGNPGIVAPGPDVNRFQPA